MIKQFVSSPPLHGHGSPLRELALGVLYPVGLRVEVGADPALEHVAGFGLQVTLAAVCRYCDCDVLHIAVLFYWLIVLLFYWENVLNVSPFLDFVLDDMTFLYQSEQQWDDDCLIEPRIVIVISADLP